MRYTMFWYNNSGIYFRRILAVLKEIHKINNNILKTNPFSTIDRTIRVTTSPTQCGPGSNYNEGVFHSSRFSKLKPHHQIHVSVIPKASLCLFSQSFFPVIFLYSKRMKHHCLNNYNNNRSTELFIWYVVKYSNNC